MKAQQIMRLDHVTPVGDISEAVVSVSAHR